MQKNLFKMPSTRGSKNSTKSAVSRAKASTTTKAPLVVKGGANSLITKIKGIVELTEKMLGDKKDDYMQTTDPIILNKYISSAIKNGEIAIDTETEGLNWIDDKLAGVCLYTPKEKPLYIPVNHINYITGQLIKDQMPIQALKNAMQTIKDKAVKVIMHNAKFDTHVINWQIGVRLTAYWDTQIAGNLLNENESHTLKYMWNKYCNGGKEDKLATYSTLFDNLAFTHIPLEVAYLYGAKDPLMTYELYQFQKEYLDPAGKHCKAKGLEDVAKVFREIEMPLIPAVTQMEDNGIAINKDYAKQLSKKYTAKLEIAEKTVMAEVDKYSEQIKKLQKTAPNKWAKLGNPINLNSPQQLAVLLYDVIGLKSPDKSKPRGTGEEIISEFNIPLTTAILEYRGLTKLLGTYIDKIPRVVNKKTGKLHASFNQYGAKTGRFSSSDPNLQNIPSKNKEIRRMFTADKGYVLLGSDFSQQEPRCLAHMSKDTHMIEAYAQGKDIYATIASKVFNVPYDECKEFRPDGSKNPAGKKRRDQIKGVVLGIMYGRGANSIATELGISKQEAQKTVDDFYNSFAQVKEFIFGRIAHCKEYGYVETAWGRKRRLPDIQLPEYEFRFKAKSKKGEPVPANVENNYLRQLANSWGKDTKKIIARAEKQDGIIIKNNGGFIAEAERQTVNSIIQGSSADITKKAMVMLYNDKLLTKLGYQMLLTVHDEVIGQCPKENAKAVASRVTELMIASAKNKISVPMKCDVEITECWYGEEVAV